MDILYAFDVDAHEILERVITFYVGSGDFNGLYVDRDRMGADELQAVEDLVREGLLQVVGEQDYINPHIRPWASKRSTEAQIAEVQGIADARYGFCLYPTPLAMAGRPEPRTFDTAPYRRRLAEGHGHLDLAYFTVDVVEQYRNDPRYHFWFGDVEVHFGIGDDAYLDPEEAERDKIASLRVGFAYDRTTLRSDKVQRYACAFLCDLADLTPEHQQRWRTYEVEPNADTGPHPMWWAMQMGHWPDGIGPFQRIIEELKALCAIFELICGQPLFRSTEPQREWGWVLRPSTQEWGQFVHLTDKLLSENLNKKALDAVHAREKNDDGTDAGTLTRLRFFLTDSTPCSDQFVDEVLKPLREVRRLRQKPAHELTVAKSDASLTAQQRDLLSDVGGALSLLRQALQNHPAARDWVPPDHLDSGTAYVV